MDLPAYDPKKIKVKRAERRKKIPTFRRQDYRPRATNQKPPDSYWDDHWFFERQTDGGRQRPKAVERTQWQYLLPRLLGF